MAQDEEKITRRTPAATVAASSARPAATLLAWYFAGSATDSATRANAARCMRASMRCRANRRSSTRRSPTFPWMNSAPCATAARWPVLRSSSTMGVSPRARSCSTTTLPIYPAPPVTRTLRPIRPLQTEQPLECFEQAVPPARLSRFLNGDGGRMQELVEKRLAEVLQLAATRGGGGGRPPQPPLGLGGRPAAHAVADLFQDGHADQPPVPRPDPPAPPGPDMPRRWNVPAAPRRR